MNAYLVCPKRFFLGGGVFFIFKKQKKSAKWLKRQNQTTKKFYILYRKIVKTAGQSTNSMRESTISILFLECYNVHRENAQIFKIGEKA